MERILTPEEKIRRAEEIYNRRRSGIENSRTTRVATVNVQPEERNYSLFKKMILQIVICFVIYFIFYLIQNSNYIFSEDVLEKTKQILSYDIDIPAMYSQTVNFFQEQTKGLIPTQDQGENQDNKEAENTVPSEEEQKEDKKEEDGNPDANAIGGAEIDNPVLEDNQQEENESQEDRPQTDDEYIKSNFSIIKPINGIVSSEFGLRDVNNPIVSKNHTGIDIAANTGTVIHAAMDGTVVTSSTTGDYGYHIKITNGDVSNLYGHCSKLYVNQGDVVKQGDPIAEVGSTGKSTGPHLHFEIMRGTNYINPRNIVDF